MADPFPVGSAPGTYATYPGRAVPGSIPARVAPDLEPTYRRLAPDADVIYGTFFPVAFNRPGSARWMREGTNFRWSLPAIVRDGLLGALDLANGTHTGEVTSRAAQTFAFGLPMVGFGLADRGALGVAGARRAAKLPMDRASIDARAKAMGFLTQPGTDDLLTVYHGTNREISPGFRLDPPERATTAGSADAGIWASSQPAVAQRHAEAASQRGGTQSILPLRARATRVAEIRLDPKMTEMEMKGAIQDAWDTGYDAVRVTNYTMQDGTPAPDNWVFKHPSQLRVPWARFDPTRRNSSDLLAGSAVPVPLAAPASALEQRTPGFRGPPSLAESLAWWRFMNEPKVY